MEIIAELEGTVRGAWCGSFFALGAGGAFDSSILIRTFSLADGWVRFPVGGGIVADSSALEEYRETLHKASGMIRALKAVR
jgi:para-aminobenzoate synthetase component 1